MKRAMVAEAAKIATRVSSQKTLEALQPILPELLGGSADLTPSNNTKTKAMAVVEPPDYRGSYIHYGVREHGMAGAMNGIALHGGFIPYGGSFFCLHRLLPSIDPPLLPDGPARHLCDDP